MTVSSSSSDNKKSVSAETDFFFSDVEYNLSSFFQRVTVFRDMVKQILLTRIE